MQSDQNARGIGSAARTDAPKAADQNARGIGSAARTDAPQAGALRALLQEYRDSAMGLLKRARLRYALGFLFMLGIWQIVDYLPRLFFDTRAFQAKLDEFLDTGRLAISYQGIDVSFFKGIRIIGVRVSFDRDFTRGRYLVEAPSVYIRQPLTLFPGQRDDLLADARIIIEGARLGYWLTADEADRETIQQARQLLQQNRNFHVECESCTFNLNVKDDSYFQEVTPVQNVHFTVKHAGNEVQTLVRYESTVIGDGDFFGKFAACKTLQCDDIEGYWFFKPTRLKIAILNNFQKDLDIVSGIASGEVAFDRQIVLVQKTERGKTISYSEGRSNFRMALGMRDFSVRKKKEIWYDVQKFTVDTRVQLIGQSATGYVRAALEDYNLQAEFENLSPDALPEKYIFSVEPRTFSSRILNLPARRKLTGLNRFSIDLSEKKAGKYGKTEMALEIKDGSFVAGPGLPPVNLSDVNITLNNEKLQGQINVAAGQSALVAALSGYLELYPVTFTPLANALMRDSGTSAARKIFTLRGKVSVPVSMEVLFWHDIKPYINAWLDDFWDEVQEGIQYSWLPSHLRRREYFVRLIQYLDFSMPIDIRRFDWGPQMPVKGNLFFSPLYAGGGFRLESGDGQNSSSLTLSYGQADTNAPYMTHDLKLNLDSAYDLLSPWLGEEYFEYFSSAQIVHINNFNGERPADHYLKSNSATDIRLKRVRLGSWARAQTLPLQWETIDIRTNRSNGFGAISSIRAENENTILSGYGEYRLFNRAIDTQLKYSVLIR